MKAAGAGPRLAARGRQRGSMKSSISRTRVSSSAAASTACSMAIQSESNTASAAIERFTCAPASKPVSMRKASGITSIVKTRTGPGLHEVAGKLLGPHTTTGPAGMPPCTHCALPWTNQVTAQAGDAGTWLKRCSGVRLAPTVSRVT
jgi:hypothetical protein